MANQNVQVNREDRLKKSNIFANKRFANQPFSFGIVVKKEKKVD